MGQPCPRSVVRAVQVHNMFLAYVDDSGDEKVRCYSALLVHESVWRISRAMMLDYRRSLKETDGVYITKELHATEFVAGRGNIAASSVSKGRRCEIFREALSVVAAMPKIQMLNAIGPRSSERQLFERLITRLNRTMAEWRSHAMMIHDEGKDYSQLVRRMTVYNPVPSRYGKWPNGLAYKNMPIERLVEDIVYRDSRKSSFIQMADFCSYALFRSEYPLASKTKYGLDKAFDLLAPICLKTASESDPRKLGIIRVPHRDT